MNEPRPGGMLIAVVNNKGGVGKTALTANLAHALAERGKKVLAVDLDAQCNLTSLLVPRDRANQGALKLLRGENVKLGDCTVQSRYKGLDCLTGAEALADLEAELISDRPRTYTLLREQLREQAKAQYDFTLFDTPPTLGFYVNSALICSDFVTVPILSGSAFSIQGLSKALKLMKEVRSTSNPDLRFLRLLINIVDKRVAMSRITTDLIYSHFREDQVFRTMIRLDTKFQQAEHQGGTILEYAPDSPGAECYRDLAGEVETITKATVKK